MNMQAAVPATPEQILDYRKRILAGELVSPEELKAGLLALRAKRFMAQQASTSKKTSKAGPARTTEDLLGMFGS
jgi:hypothetical protein